ncbi:MAG: leucine-rich repeat domain-containing protein [Muribaculaceae bacterium]|nr:leucine-rich repeat domain-containing protein [Muribaculaceae bacterium]
MDSYRNLLIALLLIVSNFLSNAEKVQVGDLYYEIDDYSLTAKVTHNFDEEGYNYVGLPAHIDVPQSIRVGETGYTVTAIGSRAFETCDGLTSVSLPNTLTSIGSSAFDFCGLTSIVIPESVKTIGMHSFRDCFYLSEISLPESLEKIGEGAFSSTAVHTITLPEGMVEIPVNLLSHTPLESITLPASVSAIGDYAFSMCGNLKEIHNINNIESIGKESFRECKSIGYLTLTDIKEIGNAAFKDCASLIKVCFGDSELTIGEDAFADCGSIVSLDFGNGLVSIGDNAFSECEGLTELWIPANVKRIGNYAFYNCMGLRSVTLEDGDASLQLGISPFANCPFIYLYLGRNIQGLNGSILTSDIFTSDKQLEKLVIGDSVTSIPRKLFSGSQSLREIWFGKNVKEVFSDAFANCANLTKVECGSIDSWSKICFDYADSNPLSNGANLYVDSRLITKVSLSSEATAIGSNAFAGYAPLTELEIPESVVSIGEQAFFDCMNLETVTVRPGKKAYGDGAFLSCPNVREIYCYDLEDWVNSRFETMYSNPITAGTKFYLDGDLLTTFELPEGLTEIGANCFSEYGCVTDVVIPESISIIGDYAFAYCNNLEAVYIGSHVGSIGKKAFNCPNIKTIVSTAAIPPVFSTKSTTASFADYTAKVYVPRGCLEAYKSNEFWKNFADIEEKDFSGVELVDDKVIRHFQIEGNMLYAFDKLEIFTLSGYRVAVIPADTCFALTDGTCHIIRCNGKSYKIIVGK